MIIFMRKFWLVKLRKVTFFVDFVSDSGRILLTLFLHIRFMLYII